MNKAFLKRWMRPLMAGVLLCVLIGGIVLLRQKPAQPDRKSLKIGVCAYKLNDTFISTILGEMDVFSKEYGQQTGVKINLDFSDAKENQRLQNEQVKRYISLDYDVICVNIVDRTTAATIIDDAVAAGIPLVFFNREPVEKDILRGDKVYYIGSDAKQTAVLQGEVVVDAMEWLNLDQNDNGVIEYFMLEGEMGHQDTVIRTEWSVQTLTNNGINVENLQSGVANWNRSQAAALVEQWLSPPRAKKPELIICNNDDMALGAVDALEKLGITGVAIVGIDATPQGLEAVRKGQLLGTVDCAPEAHAQQIFQLACGLGMNGTPPEDIEMENQRYVRVQLQKVSRINVNDVR